MTNYQKGIKVKKICENTSICNGVTKCPYYEKCKISELIKSPCFEKIETVTKVIIKEKWKVK